MANCCNKCGESGKCGCNDTVLHIPLSCPTPVCDNYNDCPETFSDCCVVHSGDTFTYFDDPGKPATAGFTTYKGEKWCDVWQRFIISQYCTAEFQAPYGFKANTVTSTTINVSWYQVPDLEGYEVQFAPVTNPQAAFTVAGTVLNNTTPNFTLTGLTPNTAYYVLVRSYAADVFSCPSVTLIITTKPS